MAAKQWDHLPAYQWDNIEEHHNGVQNQGHAGCYKCHVWHSIACWI